MSDHLVLIRQRCGLRYGSIMLKTIQWTGSAVRLLDQTRLPGETGHAAKRVAAVLHEHFLSEEEFALPPLGLLGPISGYQIAALCVILLGCAGFVLRARKASAVRTIATPAAT